MGYILLIAWIPQIKKKGRQGQEYDGRQTLSMGRVAPQRLVGSSNSLGFPKCVSRCLRTLQHTHRGTVGCSWWPFLLVLPSCTTYFLLVPPSWISWNFTRSKEVVPSWKKKLWKTYDSGSFGNHCHKGNCGLIRKSSCIACWCRSQCCHWGGVRAHQVTQMEQLTPVRCQ